MINRVDFVTAAISAVLVPLSISGIVASRSPEPLPTEEFSRVVEAPKAIVKEDGLSSSEKLAIVAQSLIDTVAWAESGWTPDSREDVYRIMFGGAKFTSYMNHPDDVQTVDTPYGPISSAAAGKYQFMPATWKGIYERYDYWPVGENGETFIPLAQDLAFLRLFNETGAFYHLEKGIRVLDQKITIAPEAIAKSMNAAAATWCSLPSFTSTARGECNDPRQSQKSMSDTIAVFNEALRRRQSLQVAGSEDISNVLEISQGWVGKDFNPGALAQCAYFVRDVFKSANMELPVTKDSFSSGDTRAGELGEGFAGSLIGSDVGVVQKTSDVSKIPAGAIVAFTNTYGSFDEGAITHVAISIGDSQMIDRPTAARPVQRRSISTFSPDSSGKYTYVIPQATLTDAL